MWGSRAGFGTSKFVLGVGSQKRLKTTDLDYCSLVWGFTSEKILEEFRLCEITLFELFLDSVIQLLFVLFMNQIVC